MVKKYLQMFLTFFKIGLFTFGGGYAMIALIESEIVEKKKWIEHDEFMDILVIAESTPGPIAINSATYVGYKAGGIFGSVLCTLGVCIPSFVIIYIISLFFNQFLELKVISSAFKGIQIAVIYLIFSAGIKMLKKMDKNPISVILMSLTILGMISCSLFAVKFSTIFYILIGAVVGLIIYVVSLIQDRRGKK